MIKRSLSSWLTYIASVHPREIELGLARIRVVAERMQLARPAPLVITVAGTNGKGSCVASMEALLHHAGYRTGSYTSPHIQLFNERVRIATEMVTDAALCDAFARIDNCRDDTSLSYFEYATLAAFHIFEQAGVDVALLEVGLGGRLDAVNLVDADVAIISSISFDHQEWLGHDLEAIGSEKAGIMRENRPVIWASDSPPPATITDRARVLGAPLLLLGTDFGFSQQLNTQRWDWHGRNADQQLLQWRELPLPRLALSNVAAALQAISLLPVQLQADTLHRALSGLQLAGRFEARKDSTSGRSVLLDVAHNTAGATMLAANLRRLREQQPQLQKIIAVVAVMADKDIEGMVAALESCVDIWYIAQVEEPRCLAASAAVRRIEASTGGLTLRQFDSAQTAYVSACEQATAQDLVLVTGSFYTVAAVRAMSELA